MEPIASFTKQQTFNKVVRHLRRQGKKAEVTLTAIKVCRYRTPDGLKCAVGCLIPDEVYDAEMEGKALVLEYGHDPLRDTVTWLGHDLSLAIMLQRIHDEWDVKDWETQLEMLAQAEGLRYTE